MNWKDKLKLEYTIEEDPFHRFKGVMLACSWRGYRLIIKTVETKPEHFNFDHQKLLLQKWHNDFVLNYDDLTTRQKRRIKNFPFIGEKFTLERKRYAKLYGYVDSEYLKYAKLKMIFVRVDFLDSYRVLPKTVICELL